VKVCVTGSEGFIGGYLVAELIAQGHEVVGVDDLSKYGTTTRRHSPDAYSLVVGDVRDPEVIEVAIEGCDHVVAGAALIGGIEYFHRYPFDILASNERIIASTCDAARRAHDSGVLRKVTYISSSMVFESADRWPSVEGDELEMPPPRSAYGFQKLAVEYFARAAHQQYGLPFTIVRPFNCVGIGEARAIRASEVTSGEIRLALSHVVPDLVQKVLRGQDPLHILGDGSQVRHYTYGGDLARGIVLAMASPDAEGESFNLSTSTATTVRQLAELIWQEVRGDDPLSVVSDRPYEHDVQMRVPDTSKATRVLGFTATTELPEVLAEVVPWIRQAMADGRI
jgi:nucleoside-diphosphate-sugar epimerase